MKTRPCIKVLIFLFVFVAILQPAFSSNKDVKHILIVNSYHKEFPWTENQVSAAKEVFYETFENVELYVEYMDTKRIYNAEYLEALSRILLMKYKDVDLDGIITTDDNALRFVLEYRDLLAEGVPITFSGINHLNKIPLKNEENVAGFVEILDIEDTVNLVVRLHPGTKKIVFVVDNTPTGQGQKKEAVKASAQFSVLNFEFVEGDKYTTEEMLEKLKSLSGDTVVILTVWLRDKANEYISAFEGGQRVSKASPVPVYGIIDMYFEYGIVGGKLLASRDHGQAAANLLVKILNKEIKPGDSPVHKKSINKYMFDHAQLERWKIDQSKLPKGSVITNRPFSIYREYASRIWIVTVMIICQFFLIMGLVINLIRRKKAEYELKGAKEKAEHVNEAKTEFLMNVSHDIRTPMNVINGFNDLLLKSPLNTEQEKFCSIIKRKGQDLIHLIEEIIDISAVEKGKIRIHFSPFDIIDLVEDVKDTVNAQLGDKEIDFNVKIGEEVVPKLLGDSLRLKQVLENLCGNAVKYTERGNICLEINSDVEPQDDHPRTICFMVEDTGVGIPKNKLAHIFEPYSRFYELGKGHEKEGVGMGLHIVETLVREMGGEIVVESELGKGSKFSFSLEMKEPGIQFKEKEKDLKWVDREVDLAGRKILIAEDDEDSRELMREALGSAKCDIQFACNGEEALEEIKKNKYDLVLMDLRMPQKDGFETTVEIRKEIGPTLPVVALTAHVMDWVGGKCQEAGMNGYISKPVDIDKLKAAIKKYILSNEGLNQER